MPFDPFALAQTMLRLNQWLDRVAGPPDLVQESFDAGEFGTAYISIAAGEDSPYASANHNRIHLCGRDGGLTKAGLVKLIARFREAGAGKFFVWLSPGPDMDAVRTWLGSAGLAPAPYVQYPTLVRDTSAPLPAATDLVIREIADAEVAEISARLGDCAWPEFSRSLGTPGIRHFVACDGDMPVASAALCVFEEVGYLGMAFTAEAHRRRGAQQALIAARIGAARKRGCRVLISETLSFLETSLGNLTKAGFAPLYEKEVYTPTSLE